MTSAPRAPAPAPRAPAHLGAGSRTPIDFRSPQTDPRIPPIASHAREPVHGAHPFRTRREPPREP
jgi:hypothetical protein